jgi:outer membrane cobalamin receptor
VKAIVSLISVVAVFSLPVCAHSQEVTLRDTVYSLPEILVEADRLSDTEAIGERPSFVSIIPVDDASRRISSAADYLAGAVGVHVQGTGGYGAYSTASVRGSSAKQVQVYVDGVPVSQAQTGMVNLADLPMASVERIEVYRGFGPYDLSGSAIGGVINLVTKRPNPGGSGFMSGTYGSFATRKYEAGYGLTRSGFNFMAAGSAVESKGDFDFLDDNGTPYNPADDATARRINNDLAEYDALLKATGPVGRGTLTASNQIYYRRQGLPGYGSVQSADERFTKMYDLFHLGWRSHFNRLVPIEIRLGTHYEYRLDHFEDRRPKKAGVKPDEKDRTTSAGIDLRWQVRFETAKQALRGMIALRQEGFQPEEIFLETRKGEGQSRSTVALGVEDEISLGSDHLRLLPALRYERYTDHTQPFETVRADMAAYLRTLKATSVTHDITSGTIGAAATPTGWLTIKANYGRYYRVPTLMELFGYRGLVVPNPGLEPEAGLNRDLGFRIEGRSGRIGALTIEYARFWSEVGDLIMFVYVPFAEAAQAINIDKAAIDGHELAMSAGPWRGLSVTANLTKLHAINTGPISYLKGKHLPNRPELEAFAGLVWTHGDASFSYGFDYIDGNYYNAYNGKAPNNKGPRFDTRRLHTITMTVPTGLPRTDFTLEVRNLTDERFEDVMGFPMPGRTVSASLLFEIRDGNRRR